MVDANGGAPMFCTVLEAVQRTGLSEHFLRDGLRSGTIPHIKSGSKYLINLPLYLDELERMSRAGATITPAEQERAGA